VTVRVPHVVQEGRVDAPVERRMFGLLAVRTEWLPDVVEASGSYQSGGMRRGGGSGGGMLLQLTLRDGRVWVSPHAKYVVRTPPREMAERLQAFLDRSAVSSLRLRRIPWLFSALAVPFFLVSVLFGLVWVNMLRRALGWGGPAGA
jgi:hypothetical protein